MLPLADAGDAARGGRWRCGVRLETLVARMRPQRKQGGPGGAGARRTREIMGKAEQRISWMYAPAVRHFAARWTEPRMTKEVKM